MRNHQLHKVLPGQLIPGHQSMNDLHHMHYARLLILVPVLYVSLAFQSKIAIAPARRSWFPFFQNFMTSEIGIDIIIFESENPDSGDTSLRF
jgi:hypothetical protein